MQCIIDDFTSGPVFKPYSFITRGHLHFVCPSPSDGSLFSKKKKEESRKKKIAIDLEKEPNYEKFKIHTFPSTDMQSLFSVCTVLN